MRDISSNIPLLVVSVKDSLKICRQVHHQFIIPADVRPVYALHREMKCIMITILLQIARGKVPR